MHIRPNHSVSDFTVKILIASFFAQVMTVAVHHFGAIENDFSLAGYDISNLPVSRHLINYFFHMSIGFGTVAFFCIAGFLFFHEFEKEGSYARKVKSRLKTLGIPYLLWNFIASPWFTVILIPVFALFMPWIGSARETDLIEVFFGYAPGFYPANQPLWFLRELLLVCILSPLIWRIFRSRWGGPVFLIVSFIAWVISIHFFWGGLENITQAIFAFSLGGYWKKKEWSLFSFSTVTGLIASAFAILLVAAEIFFELPLNIVVALKCVAGCIIIFWLADRISQTRFAYFFAWLGEAAFFMYLIHIIGRREVAFSVIHAVKPHTELATIMTVFIIWLVIVVYAVIVWALLRRFAPKVLNVLLGGRVKKHFSWKK